MVLSLPLVAELHFPHLSWEGDCKQFRQQVRAVSCPKWKKDQPLFFSITPSHCPAPAAVKEWEESGACVQWSWSLALLPLLANCVTLGRVGNLSGP